MSNVSTYQFGLLDVRVLEIEGQPWFVAVDVCKALGYSMKDDGSVNTTNALRSCAPDEISTARIRGHRGPEPKVVSESGLYKLLMRSNTPNAKPFQDWVTRVVLPAIRKDGAYVLGEEKVATGEMSEDELLSKAFGILQKKTERLTLERDQARDEALKLGALNHSLQIEQHRLIPHAEVGQAVAKRKALGVVDFCRKLPGVNVNAVQTRLYDMQYFHKKYGHWSVYAKFKGTLFDETFSPEGYSKVIVLEAGQQKLVDLYHSGLLPMCKGKTPLTRRELDL